MRATRGFSAGELVVEYVGEVIEYEEVAVRRREQERKVCGVGVLCRAVMLLMMMLLLCRDVHVVVAVPPCACPSAQRPASNPWCRVCLSVCAGTFSLLLCASLGLGV